MNNTEQLVVRLNKELKDSFKEKCKENRTTMSHVIWKAVKTYTEENK